ncbi:MAG: hypothetical protein FWE39_13545, partial [Nocardiaceae bacterium]|nr:hypothetical protein [Nocardiaceae bacterium]
PFGSVLFSTDGCGLPELFHVAAAQFRTALAELLEKEVRQGRWSRNDAERVARMITGDNARRVYRLESPSSATDQSEMPGDGGL